MLGVLAAVGVLSVTPTPVTLCHATGQPDHYASITVANSAAAYGHFGEHHQGGKDIIPPFVHHGITYSQHWDAVGRAIYDRQCTELPPDPIPTPTPEPTPDPTPTPEPDLPVAPTPLPVLAPPAATAPPPAQVDKPAVKPKPKPKPVWRVVRRTRCSITKHKGQLVKTIRFKHCKKPKGPRFAG